DQPPPPKVHDDRRPHAVEALEGLLSPGFVCRQDDLRVAGAAEDSAQTLQFTAQLSKVVDLAVIDDPRLAVWGDHGLGGRFAEIDDLEPSEGEAHSDPRTNREVIGSVETPGATDFVDEQEALAVGPAVTDRLVHASQDRDTVQRGSQVEQRADAAHGSDTHAGSRDGAAHAIARPHARHGRAGRRHAAHYTTLAAPVSSSAL